MKKTILSISLFILIFLMGASSTLIFEKDKKKYDYSIIQDGKEITNIITNIDFNGQNKEISLVSVVNTNMIFKAKDEELYFVCPFTFFTTLIDTSKYYTSLADAKKQAEIIVIRTYK